MIDHVTYAVPIGVLDNPDIAEFFALLGLTEVKPDEVIEKGWRVRWWSDDPEENGKPTLIHLVEDEDLFNRTVDLSLGHFCIRGIGRDQFEKCRKDSWCRRDSGSGRIWLEGPFGIRVEVRS